MNVLTESVWQEDDLLASLRASEVDPSPAHLLKSEPRKVEIDLTNSLRESAYEFQHHEADENDDWAKYETICVLGEGTYGKVYKVTLKENPTECLVVKEL